MLELKKVEKKFEDHIVLHDCSFKLDDGSIVGLIGKNGSGKSTLLRCVSGIYQSDAGQVLWNNQEVYENELIKKEIMYLSDELYISSSMTIKGLKNFYLSFYTGFDEKLYRSYLDMFDFKETMVLRKLSKGMRRQAFILTILSFKPKLLVLDETFDGLDPMIRKMIKKAIGNLVADELSTVLISSHSLHDIESICDHIIFINDGDVSNAEDIDENKEDYHRFQLAFDRNIIVEDFSPLEIVDLQIHSKVVTLIVKGHKQEIIDKLNSLSPLMLEELDLSLEDLFIARMKGGKKNV